MTLLPRERPSPNPLVRTYLVGMTLIALVLLFGPVRVIQAAGIVVDSTLDTSGDVSICTLRDAIVAANTDSPQGGCTSGSPGLDTVAFDVTLPATITLGSTLPTITEDLAITGPGAADLAVSGGNSVRILDIAAAQVNIANLTLARGNAAGERGGGINANGSRLTLVNVDLVANTAGTGGGLNIIGATSAVTITNSAFSNNLADGTDCAGGGIDHDAGILVVSGTSFTENSATCSVGTIPGFGGAIDNDGGTVTITESTFSGNTASPNDGGAIYTAVPTEIVASTFTGNSADALAGAIENEFGTLTIVASALTNNVAGLDGGGAIWATGSTKIESSTLSVNGARAGGAIYQYDGALSVRSSTFFSNTASLHNGGAIWARVPFTIANSTFFANNTVAFGGAVYSQSGEASSILNSTFSDNSASGTIPSGAPARVLGHVGGKHPRPAASTRVRAFQSAAENAPGGAIYNVGPLELVNTILANSPAGGNCGGTITDGGNNLQFSPNSGCGTITSGDPRLDSLANNGGPTMTMALLPGSAAINEGNNTVCGAEPVNAVDQRGVSRPQPPGGICDIGAFEAQLNYLYLPLVQK